ncbi:MULTISPECIES: AAA family ATPase [unclassified Janthinobacterium]|uniref:AAA family ATPase n=1 Tax=unclassified Janthinobacterium TaxID=2610881 RepID=UPI001E38C3A3|nr:MULTISPECIES: AAA family ATPase [unclassified Janthinobacterium]MCC7643973.1 AAA family ATPase [Janthinobacterium sp. EB271-G4-3-1]MCC7692066.1 AAA family ATPase [Janthinobacterium sp. EB271-G4-3-2]
MNLYKRGLVVGKFCPLHQGHELLIHRAQDASEELLVVSYTKPEFPGCEPARRDGWLRAQFPQAHIVVLDDARLAALCAARGVPARTLPHNDDDGDAHRHFMGWLCWTVLERPVDAVFTSEDYGPGFARVLERHYASGPVAHVSVDQARTLVPVSGTVARQDPHAHSAFLSPIVRADFVTRVCVLGGESSGKTTLAQALAAHFETAWVAEYGRELWESQDGMLAYDDLLKIGREQLRREAQALLAARRWLFCDTSPMTTYFYCVEMFGKAEQELAQLAEHRYDLVLLCAPDFPFIQDGTRRDEDFRARQHAWYQAELARRGIAYVNVSGTVAGRVGQAAQLLARRSD